MAYSMEEIDDIFNKICPRIVKGEALRNILLEDGMPDYSTFYAWINKYPEKSQQYAQAKELDAERTFEEIILISDGTDDDILIDEDGKEQTNHHVIQRDKLRIDARKWALSKRNPKKYGDKLETKNEHSGEITITRVIKK